MLPSLKKDNLSFDSKNITFTILNEIIASITKEEKIENKKKPTEFLFKNLVEVNEQPIIRQLKFIRK